MRTIIYLFSLTALLMTGCSKEKNLYNESASFNDSTKISGVLEGKVITTMSDKKQKTMSTLYGNEIAANYARSAADQSYPTGSELSLVTWSQKEDIYWYGAEIPGKILSIEVVKYANPGSTSSYETYVGNTMALQGKNPSRDTERTHFIVSQKAAVLP